MLSAPVAPSAWGPRAYRRSRARCVEVRAATAVNPASILKGLFGGSKNGNGVVRDAAFTKDVITDEQKYILQTYARAPVVISHGKGAKMWDVEGKEYIDMAAGIAVNALGHSDGAWWATPASCALFAAAQSLSSPPASPAATSSRVPWQAACASTPAKWAA
jgi:hypothetical protein